MGPLAAAGLLWAWAGLLAVPPALADEPEDAVVATQVDVYLQSLAERAVELSERTAELEALARPGVYLSPGEAEARFQEYLYQHLIGEHAPAAQGFYALVSTGVLQDAGLHRDAEWYLGESLLGLENYDSAAVQFRKVVQTGDHPFREDGVRRLLELYARAGDRDAFQDLYDTEIVQGRVAPSGLVTYTVAKGYYQQDDLPEANDFFSRVPEGDPWFTRARYFMGTIALRQRDHEAAKMHFERVADAPVGGPEHRRVQDLALLALGRLHYEEGDYDGAAPYYDRIPTDSAYQIDKLYELIWTSIRRERWQEALTTLEIFLLAYPDHHYSPQLVLLQGHLHIQQEHWDDALRAYEQVVVDYAPVRQRFEELARPDVDAEAEVREVVEAVDGAAQLPPYAVAMMRADKVLARAMGVFGDLAQERRDIQASERLVDELRSFLESKASVGPYEPLRMELLERRAEIVRARVALLRIHAGIVGDERSLDGLEDAATRAELPVREARQRLDTFERKVGARRAESADTRARREDLEAELEELEARRAMIAGSARAAEVDQQIATVQRERDAMTHRLTAIDAALAAVEMPQVLDAVEPAMTDVVFFEVSARQASIVSSADPAKANDPRVATIEGADVLLVDAYGRLGAALEATTAAETVDVVELRERFRREVGRLAELREAHARTLEIARGVSLELTRQGFARLGDLFAESLLKADMGIVDVFWARRLEVGDELSMLRRNRDEVVTGLERRFGLIRERLGDEL